MKTPFVRLFVTASVLCVGGPGYGYGQGTIQITFDGPSMPDGTSMLVARYDEAGISFTPIDPSDPDSRFVRRGADNMFFPENGSTYVQAALGSTLSFSFIDGSVFDLLSVDLAEYSTVVFNAVTVHFVGYRWDGTVVTADLTTDGVIDGTGPLADFETLELGKEFTGLVRVEIPTWGWSLDNVVVSVPEPGAVSLLLVGAVAAWGFRRRCRSK